MIKIYNSLSRKKEVFKPLKKGEVKIYACGVTPYDEIHIGHARQAVVYDVIRAYFEYRGYKTDYVRNFTDIDDKIINRAIKEGRESAEVSEYFIRENSVDLDRLKVKRAGQEPKVTECIADIIEFIQVLLDKGFAYEADGEVFFDIAKFPGYGKLSNRRPEELINTEESPNKKSPNDFVLWKPHKPGEPFWDSPWSKGRPGWHIECSVMAKKFLGEEIDIHGGGLDLIFPHHENELAQSEAYSGRQFAKYWIHNGLVMINGSKMSKSLGNFLTVKAALKDYFPEEIRYAMLVQHYHSPLDFSAGLFKNARKRMHYFYTGLARIKEIAAGSEEEADLKNMPEMIAGLEKKFTEYMDDNFNTPKAISMIAEAFKELNRIADSNDSRAKKSAVFKVFFRQFKPISDVLRLFNEEPAAYLSGLKRKILAERKISEEFIEEKLAMRQQAKEAKDYGRADQVKAELAGKGISVQDSQDKVNWELVF